MFKVPSTNRITFPGLSWALPDPSFRSTFSFRLSEPGVLEVLWHSEVVEDPTAVSRINAAQSHPHHQGEQSKMVCRVEHIGGRNVGDVHQG